MRCTSSAKECIHLASVVVVATPWPEFLQIPAAVWARDSGSGPRIVVDCWRALPSLGQADGVTYLSLGTGMTAVNLEDAKLLTV